MVKAKASALSGDLIPRLRISSFDSTRREIAKIALEKLIKDGRIQPLKIEQVVAQTKTEMIEFVNAEQSRLKRILSKEGVRFNNEENQFHESIIGNQRISGFQNLKNAFAYEEINYIREGLVYEWATMIDERERFDPIMNQVKELEERFE